METTYTHLIEKQEYHDADLRSWCRDQFTSMEALKQIAGYAEFPIGGGWYQSPNLYVGTNPSERTLEAAKDEAIIWLRSMARAVRQAGFAVDKFSNDYNFGFRVRDTFIQFSVPTELSCKQVPVTDDAGEPVYEEVTESVYETITVTKQKMRKECVSLVAPLDL